MIKDVIPPAPPIWLQSDNFEVKLTGAGNLRFSRINSRYLFFEKEELDELIELLTETRSRLIGGFR